MDIPIPSQHTPPQPHNHENLIVGMHENSHVRWVLSQRIVVVFEIFLNWVMRF